MPLRKIKLPTFASWENKDVQSSAGLRMYVAPVSRKYQPVQTGWLWINSEPEDLCPSLCITAQKPTSSQEGLLGWSRRPLNALLASIHLAPNLP